jgi:hypothetical protein
MSISAQAAVTSHSKAIIVETPADLPEAAQVASEAIYLHDTNDGKALLYLEQNDGKKLAILDVTDPAHIKSVARVSIAAAAPFDFDQAVGNSTVLIRYRDNSGVATLNLRHAENPVLGSAPQAMNTGFVRTIGEDGLLLTSEPALPSVPQQAHMSLVIETTSASQPTLLYTVMGVTQSVSNPATGTLFLLGDGGLTAVRQTSVEQEHTIEQMQMSRN